MIVMGVNKVVYGAVSIIDISDSTVTPETVAEGETAYGADGEKITGTMRAGVDTSDATAAANDIANGKTAYVNGEKITGNIVHETAVIIVPEPPTVTFSLVDGTLKPYLNLKYPSTGKKRIIGGGKECAFQTRLSNLGDATAEDVAEGKTFTSSAGLKVTGTHVCSTTEPTLQSKSVTPSESAQTVTPDDGYDGLSSVEVGAVSSTYIGSGVTKKAAATYTPGTADQTIASGQYLSGAQTIKGDANLLATNIKSGVSIFGVAGSYTGSSGSTGGLVMKTGTTTSDTIDTGLSSISFIAIYKDTLTATGLIQGVYSTDEGKLHYTYCFSYNTYFKQCTNGTSTESSVSGGTFTLGTSGTSGLSSSTTYSWIAFGTA